MVDFHQNSSTQAQFVEIAPDRAGQRIDNFLINLLKGVPKSLIYRVIRTGQVRVNKGRVKAPYRLKQGGIVRVPPIKLPEQKEKQRPAQHVLTQIEVNILYEDEGLIILNKPSGIAVHGGSGINFGVIEAIRELKPKLQNLELVHRLDRDTSGCLLIAKKRSALRELHESLRKGQVEKHYFALCAGKWKGNTRVVDAPLRKNTLSSGERIVIVSPDGKDAESRFIVKQRFKRATLMEVALITGRTHQIRVHAAYSGHPIAGDSKYGDKTFNQEMKSFGLKRLFLHAHRLSFPWEGRKFEIVAPLGDELENVMSHLE